MAGGGRSERLEGAFAEHDRDVAGERSDSAGDRAANGRGSQDDPLLRGKLLRGAERIDVLECARGEEAQVQYGQGALTRTARGNYRRPYLFVMTLKYSGKSFRKVVWKTSQEVWARLHEEAFRAFGGSTRYVVLD